MYYKKILKAYALDHRPNFFRMVSTMVSSKRSFCVAPRQQGKTTAAIVSVIELLPSLPDNSIIIWRANKFQMAQEMVNRLLWFMGVIDQEKRTYNYECGRGISRNITGYVLQRGISIIPMSASNPTPTRQNMVPIDIGLEVWDDVELFHKSPDRMAERIIMTSSIPRRSALSSILYWGHDVSRCVAFHSDDPESVEPEWPGEPGYVRPHQRLPYGFEKSVTYVDIGSRPGEQQLMRLMSDVATSVRNSDLEFIPVSEPCDLFKARIGFYTGRKKYRVIIDREVNPMEFGTNDDPFVNGH